MSALMVNVRIKPKRNQGFPCRAKSLKFVLFNCADICCCN